MSGHSKWSNTKHRKKSQDAKRSKLCLKFINEIVIAAKQGPKSDTNPKLRAAVSKALTNNVSKQTIQKAVQRGSREFYKDNRQETTNYFFYEIVGPGNCLIVIASVFQKSKILSDRKFLKILDKYKKNITLKSSLNYAFHKKGIITFNASSNEQDFLDTLLDWDIEDIQIEQHTVAVLTSEQDFTKILNQLLSYGKKVTKSVLDFTAINKIKLQKQELLLLHQITKDLQQQDHIQHIYCNAI